MGRVDVALQDLQPVAVLGDLRGDVLRLGDERPFHRGERRGRAARAHVRPDDAAALLTWIRDGSDLVLEIALGRLVRHVETAPGDVELPAVVDAAQAMLFVAPEEQRCAPVRAVQAQDARAAGAVAESDEVLAEDSEASGRTIGCGQFGGEQRRHPVLPEELAHGRARANLREQLVVFF